MLELAEEVLTNTVEQARYRSPHLHGELHGEYGILNYQLEVLFLGAPDTSFIRPLQHP